jgi:hypothetical protein
MAIKKGTEKTHNQFTKTTKCGGGRWSRTTLNGFFNSPRHLAADEYPPFPAGASHDVCRRIVEIHPVNTIHLTIFLL